MSFWLRIIQINDVYELDRLANLATLVKKESKEPHETICILAGDFLAPSLLSSLDHGRGMIDCLNNVGITHVCWGNHETDVPPMQIAKRVQESHFQWINSNMREIDDKLGIKTPEYTIVEVSNGQQKKRVCLLGLLTHDPSLYRPGSFAGAKIDPIPESAERLLDYIQETEKGVDLILPMTHQGIEQDRKFAQKFGGQFPVVMGGHDHEVFDEVHDGCRIIKTGHDAINAAIIDIRWEGNSSECKPCSVTVDMVPTTNYEIDLDLQSRIDGHHRILKELESAKLFPIDSWTPKGGLFSTLKNRLGPSTGSRALTSMLRMGLCCQCCIVNAGSIRGNQEYEPGAFFTWKDLKSEIPFSTKMTACYIPGSVLEAMIRHSRSYSKASPPVAKGGYLHTCNNIVYDDGLSRIESIQGKPFNPDFQYLTALPCQFFEGIDNHMPLLEWYDREQELSIDAESALPAKMVIVQTFSALLWLQLGSFRDLDKDQDGLLTKDEVRQEVVRVYGESVADLVIENVFDVADMNGDGTISPLEMMVIQFVATDMTQHVCTQDELRVMKEICLQVLGPNSTKEEVQSFVFRLREKIDLAGDGSIHRDEVLKALGALEEGANLLK